MVLSTNLSRRFGVICPSNYSLEKEARSKKQGNPNGYHEERSQNQLPPVGGDAKHMTCEHECWIMEVNNPNPDNWRGAWADGKEDEQTCKQRLDRNAGHYQIWN